MLKMAVTDRAFRAIAPVSENCAAIGAKRKTGADQRCKIAFGRLPDCAGSGSVRKAGGRYPFQLAAAGACDCVRRLRMVNGLITCQPEISADAGDAARAPSRPCRRFVRPSRHSRARTRQKPQNRTLRRRAGVSGRHSAEEDRLRAILADAAAARQRKAWRFSAPAHPLLPAVRAGFGR